jgi:hypothetical protein
MKHILSKADAVLFVLIVLIAVAGIVLMAGGNGGQTAQIRIDGRIVREVRLDTDQTFWVDTVRFEVRDGSIRYAESDCPGQECVHVGWMSRPGSSMACLPNRVSVTIIGQSGVDAIAE